MLDAEGMQNKNINSSKIRDIVLIVADMLQVTERSLILLN